jgi:16S rRNA (guanine966-N2)-methyltransferase
MRITGGDCRGRVINGPDGLAVRPTASKVRQAFFNILSNKIEGAVFVDVCAGSGLMGFEALSRGAAGLILIEENKRLAQAIKENVKLLGFTGVAEVIIGDARRVLPLLGAGEADIIFVDPPYKAKLATPILQTADTADLLKSDGVFAIEHANDDRLPEETHKLVCYDRRKYGQTAVSFYRKKSD